LGRPFVVSKQNIIDSKAYLFSIVVGVILFLFLNNSERPTRPVYWGIAYFIMYVAPFIAVGDFLRKGFKDGRKASNRQKEQ
jgi:hypothetical protein